MGFLVLENRTTTKVEYLKSFLTPEAKIKEGIWLAQQKHVSSMTDISDGMYLELKQLCTASNKGVVIDLDILNNYLKNDISLKIPLEGGVDYSLLFTIDLAFFEILSK